MEETQRASQEARYPLAFDGNGNPLEVPPEAIAWRVRRGGGRRGRPRHVFDPETGRQLEVPLTSTIDTLIDAGCLPDRYLLYPVDGQSHVIQGVIAVTEVPEGADGESGAVSVAQPGEAAALLAVVTHQLATIKEQSQTLCRALEATTSGYGRVRPSEPPQQPLIVEAPSALPEKDGGFLANIDPAQVAQLAGYAKMIVDMVRGSAPAAGGA